MSADDPVVLQEGLLAVWLSVMGLCIGSFLNVVIARVPLGLSVVKPRSRCPRCGHELAWYENIPVLSWLFLRGRCRGCKLPISWRYPAIELLTGFLFVACLRRFGWTYELVPALVLVVLLVPLTFIDLEHWILPFSLTVPGIVLGPLLAVPLGAERWKAALIGVVAGFVVFRLLEVVGQAIFKKEALGAGDKMLLALIGGFLGWQALLGVIFFSMFQGAIVGMVLLSLHGRAGPAGPAAVEQDETTPPATVQPASMKLTRGEKLLHRLLLVLGLADPLHPETQTPLEDDWAPGATSLPLGPWLALAALELLLLGPWLSRTLPGNLGQVLTGS